MPSGTTLNLNSTPLRISHAADLLHEVNVRLCELYKKDYIYLKSSDMYKRLVRFNDQLLSMVEKATNTQQPRSFDTISGIPRATFNEHTSNLGVDLDLLEDIEIKLCEVCDRYEAVIENNPYATASLKEKFEPMKIEIVGFIKSARKTIYSYC